MGLHHGSRPTGNTAGTYTERFAPSPSPASGFSYQGSTYWYVQGGYHSSNRRDRFPFASDANGTNIGTGAYGRGGAGGAFSATHGYAHGGYNISGFPYGTVNQIEKFPFAADTTTGSDVGDLYSTAARPGGHSSGTHGYSAGGRSNTPPPAGSNVIQKYPISSDANSTDVGNLIRVVQSTSSSSSSTHGYTSGGNPNNNVIDKFPFSSDANATDVGDLTQSRWYSHGGHNSTTHGYHHGGYPSSNVIDRWPFSSDANAVDVGDTSSSGGLRAGGSSPTHGYTAGTWSYGNSVEKVQHVASANATDVGDLSQGRADGAGTQI